MNNSELENITKKLDEFKLSIDNLVLSNTLLVQEIANQINVKLDILCNMENISKTNVNNNIKKKNAIKVLSKKEYFKKKLTNNLNEFIDVLYTNEELENIKENSEVKSKKTAVSKKNKIIELLYNLITKQDENKHTIFKQLYEKYKLESENESVVDNESIISSTDEIEETKTNT